MKSMWVMSMGIKYHNAQNVLFILNAAFQDANKKCIFGIIHIKLVHWAIQNGQLTCAFSCGDIGMDIRCATYANIWLEESWLNTWQAHLHVQSEYVVNFTSILATLQIDYNFKNWKYNLNVKWLIHLYVKGKNSRLISFLPLLTELLCTNSLNERVLNCYILWFTPQTMYCKNVSILSIAVNPIPLIHKFCAL